MNSALMPYRPPASSALLQLAASRVACDLHASAGDASDGAATYELGLSNEADVAVSGRLYGVDGRRRERTFGALEVAAHSEGRSLFMVPLQRGRHEARLYVEVIGEGIHLLAETQRPGLPSRDRRLPAPGVLLFCGSMLVALAAGVAVFGARNGLASPSAIALAAPHRAPPGIVDVVYAIPGSSRAFYRATSSDGTVMSSGTLRPPGGDIALAVPASAAGRSVHVTLDAEGSLGHVSRSADFDVALPPLRVTASAAQVSSLTAHRETSSGQQSVLVSYSAVADGGTVSILDARGSVVAAAPFTHAGANLIALPREANDQPLRAELLLTRGNSRAHAAVDVPPPSDEVAAAARILAAALRGATSAQGPSALSSGGPSTDPGAGAQQDDGSNALPSDPFYVPDRVVGGQSFTVAVRRVLPHMHIELQDDVGTSLDDRPVPPGTTSVTLDAPKTGIVQTYYLAGTFVQASGEETLVRSIRVFPR